MKRRVGLKLFGSVTGFVVVVRRSRVRDAKGPRLTSGRGWHRRRFFEASSNRRCAIISGSGLYSTHTHFILAATETNYKVKDV